MFNAGKKEVHLIYLILFNLSPFSISNDQVCMSFDQVEETIMIKKKSNSNERTCT